MNLRLLVQDNYWLLLVFALYLITIFIFSVIYYLIHSRNPESFSFNEDVLRSQRETFKVEAERGIALLNLRLQALNELLIEMKGAPFAFPSVGETNKIQVNEFSFEITTVLAGGMLPGGARIGHGLHLYDKSGNRLLSISTSEFPGVIKKTEKKLDRLRKRLATLSTMTPMVWSYWDFLYFSVITQATVGYGDMLPNRTSVRMLVCLQTLIALLFLVVIINLVFQKI